MIRSSASVPLSSAALPFDVQGLKRSGGRLSDLSTISNTNVTRSSSGQSGFHLSSSTSGGGGGGTPSSHRRRSTETSGSGGGLDYYWSNAAGVGPSSSSSSLAMSPSPSIGLVDTLSQSGTGGEKRKGLYRRSEASLRDLIAQEQRRADGHADERMTQGVVELESPSWSGESDYSSSHSLPMSSTSGGSAPGIGGGAGQRSGPTGPVNVWNTGEREAEAEYDYARQSMASTSTARSPTSGQRQPNENTRTPLILQSENRPDHRSPGYVYTSDSLHATPIVSQTNFNRAQPSPSSYTPGSGRLDSSGVRRGGSSPASTEQGSKTRNSPGPGTGFVPGGELVDEPQVQSAPPWQAEFGLGMGSVGEEAESDITLKGRGRDKRATLPALPADLADSDLLSPDKQSRGSGSPQPPPRSALRTQLAGITSPLPNLSFDYNPSAIRGSHSPLNISPPSRDVSRLSRSSTPASSPPMSRQSSSDHPSLFPSRLNPNDTSAALDDSMMSRGSINDLTELLGGAIDEIGLIDSRETPPPMISADSRDKPRPGPLSLGTNTSSELMADGTEGKRPITPITPGSLPSRGESLSSGTGSVSAGSGSGSGNGSGPGMVPAPNPGPSQNEERHIPPPIMTSNTQYQQQQHQQHQRQTSVSTLHAPGSATTGGFSTRPWPAAMLFGHIKNMKHAGDRAKYYAKGINDLAVADSGLRDWCVISASSAHRIPPARVPLNRYQTNMSMSPTSRDFAPSIQIQSANPSSFGSQTRTQAGGQGQPSSHPRNVSSSSEFPMREDSYTAREISQRVIDPGDEPTSLPPNLPYPQLQQVRNGGMRNSPSVASMASMASTATGTTAIGSGGAGGGSVGSGSGSGSGKRGFFSALRGKKDSGGLGPPTGQIPTGASGGAGAGGKKDVRGMRISGPGPERSSLSGPSPMGPRGPRMGGSSGPEDGMIQNRHSLDTGSATASYRGSLDMDGMRGLTPPSSASIGRASFDSASTTQQQRMGQLQGTKLQQVVNSGGGGGGGLNEDEVRSMQDVLPHVDRGVLRAYLAKHGDQMSAITAYFEDEKRGPII